MLNSSTIRKNKVLVKNNTNINISNSLRKHPFLLALHLRGRFARRFLLSKRPKRRGARRNGCFRRLYQQLIYVLKFQIVSIFFLNDQTLTSVLCPMVGVVTSV